jgi:DNA-binding MarR family transcriptional regulator
VDRTISTEPPSNRRYEALLRLLRTANAIWDASRVFFEQWDLSSSQFNVLNLLHAHAEGLSQTELGRQLLTHRSNVTGLVDRLEKRGLVQRKSVSGDRRAYRVVLTKSGANLLKKILPRYHEEAQDVWAGVSDKGISELLDALEHVTRNAAKVTPAPKEETNGRRRL